MLLVYLLELFITCHVTDTITSNFKSSLDMENQNSVPKDIGSSQKAFVETAVAKH